jgi:outer membrane protein TolC
MQQTLTKTLYVLLLTLMTGQPAALSAQPVLDHYIATGLSDNLVLQTRKISLEKSLYSLKEARSYFLPTTYLDGSYTLANGGRSISIPVGDLLNPVYQTLNQLTGTEKFPTVSNTEEQLLPNNFYDLRIRTTVPLYNTDLKYNRSIRLQETKLNENEVIIYVRELVREIKTAYYTYLMAGRAIQIYEHAIGVVKQNLKINQSLLRNGKGLPAYVSRAESEVMMVEAQLQNARNEQQKARAYFNSLLNKNLEDSIESEEPGMETVNRQLLEVEEDDISRREELKGLMIARDINTLVYQMNKAYHAPKVSGFLDLAAQDFDFRVKSNSFFYLGGLQVTVPIFSGNRNLYKIRQSELELKNNQLSTGHTRKQLELAAFTSRNNARNHYINYLASLRQEESSRQYFKLIDRGYLEGINTFIELLDARNQLTQSQLQVALNKYRLLIAMADYERQTSSYTLN